MRPLSNLPPGVTDAMIDAHFGGDISEGPEEWDDEDDEDEEGDFDWEAWRMAVIERELKMDCE